MFHLINPIVHYTWGARDEIPLFCGYEPDGRPHAEMWIGAHASAPSVATLVTPPELMGVVDDGHSGRLDELVELDPSAVLGDECVQRFGPRLPYLVKLLAADRPLSLQTHPDADYARRAYEQEQAGDPTEPRQHPDPYAKPELLLALAPTLALVGFRAPMDALAGLAALQHHDVAAVRNALSGSGSAEERVRAAFQAALGLPHDAVAAVVSELRAQDLPPSGQCPDAAGVARLLAEHHNDAGVIASFLLNAIYLEPGCGVYVAPGVMHAYVHGFGLEVMASSDNVLRAGLTPKMVNIPDVITVVDFIPTPAQQLRAVVHRSGPWGVEARFESPAHEFHVTTMVLDEGSGPVRSCLTTGPRVVVCLEHSVQVLAGDVFVDLARGEAVFVTHSDGPLEMMGVGHVAIIGLPQ